MSRPSADLPEASVVGGDRQIADEVQHVAATDRVARDHRHDRLRQAADLDVQIGHMEAANSGLRGSGLNLLVVQVSGVAPHALVAPRAEGVWTLAGEHDHTDLCVLARILQGSRDLDDRLWPERVAHLGRLM